MKSASHQQQHDEAVVRSLNKAGIRPRYHKLGLKECRHPAALSVLDWIMGPSIDQPGRGYTFVGGNSAEDLAILTARGLHVTGRSCKVFPLIRYIELLATDREYLDTQEEAVGTLLITHAGPVVPGETVYTTREIRQVEYRLDAWLAEGHRLLLHSKLPLNGGWYAEDFLQRVAAVNDLIGEWK